MTTPFNREYANAYDALYGDKDYDAECDLLEEVFRRFAGFPIRTVLDLGCGSGSHAIRLAQRGFKVVGVDRSPAMLAAAKAKAASHDLPISLHEGDIRRLDLQQQFDAVVMMFAVLGYQTENADVLDALTTVRRHLRPHGLLIFDCWNGLAVLSQRPGDRVKVVPTGNGKIVRIASAALDVERQFCEVHYRLLRLEGDGLIGETEEKHQLRFFFPREIELFLRMSDLRLLRVGAFPDLDRPADEATWNALVVATAEAPAT
jgi:SAM-dependent methyltransferase